MHLNISIPAKLKIYFDAEIAAYNQEMLQGNLQQAWCHLERAHIIGQAYPFQHTYAHWKMLKFGIRIKSFKEVLGQLPRLLVGGVKSFVGKIPVGNTGGSNVPPLRSLPIPPDIQQMFEISRKV